MSEAHENEPVRMTTDDEHLANVLRRFVAKADTDPTGEMYVAIDVGPDGAAYLTIDGWVDVTPDETAAIRRARPDTTEDQ